MRRLLVALALFITGAATGAGALATWTARDDSRDDTAIVENAARPTDAASAVTPTPPPSGPFSTLSTPSPAPAAPPAHTPRGTATPGSSFVVLRGRDLWLTSPSRPGQDEQLTAGSQDFAGFAGAVGTGPRTSIYFTEFTEIDGVRRTALLRRQLTDRVTSEVFSFPSYKTYGTPAAVSPDGQSIAYVSPTGVHVIHLPSGLDRVLVSPSADYCRDQPRRSTPCVDTDHFHPSWSATGRFLAYFERRYEPGSIMVLDLDQPDPTPPRRPLDGDFAAGRRFLGFDFVVWSPSGDSICGHTGDGFAGTTDPPAMPLLDVATNSFRWLEPPADAAEGLPEPILWGALACRWSPRGELAVHFSRRDALRRDSTIVAFYGTTLTPRAAVAVPPRFHLRDWLPTGDGLIITDYNGSPQKSSFLLVEPSGALLTVPLEADELLAILP